MITPPNQQTDEYLAARRESCRLLGLNPDDLTAHEAIRADLATVLRLWLDGSQSSLLAGGNADPTRILAVHEALTKLMPEREHRSHIDPRRIMFETYMGMRARGAAFGEGYDGLKLTVERLQAELASKDAEIAALKADAPAPDEPSAMPPASAAPAPASAGNNVVKLSTPRAVDVNALPPAEVEPWRAFVNADGSIRSQPRGRWDV